MKNLIHRAQIRFRDIFLFYTPGAPVLETSFGFTSTCPIHKGKDPSHFSYRDDYGCWSCFSDLCGRGESIISFVMKMDNIDFYAALEKIETILDTPAKFAKYVSKEGIDLKSLYMDIDDLKEKIGYITFEMLARECPEDREAIEYIYWQRGFFYDIVKEFQLGFSIKEDCPIYRRVIIPVHGLKKVDGKSIVGVQARAMTDSRSKYLNFGLLKSEGFPSSLVLFNYHKVKKEMPLLVTEGPLCAIKAWQYGYRDSVAILGSYPSLTQIKLIGSFHKKVIIALDRDKKSSFPSIKEKLLSLYPYLEVEYLDQEDGRDIADITKVEFWERIKELL